MASLPSLLLCSTPLNVIHDRPCNYLTCATKGKDSWSAGHAATLSHRHRRFTVTAASPSTTEQQKKSEPELAISRPTAGDPKASLIQRSDDPMAWREYREPIAGDEPDFWEGSQWDWLGFLLEYLPAIGIAVAVLAAIYAVRSYNDGATREFKDTDAFKASTSLISGDDNGSNDDSSPAAGGGNLLDDVLGDAPPL
eukprot:TRINITY_DN26652_c0_g1_i1.p1 TRINITY_DN26652_c0_g1~~TRINITY_DN26652_c0_g1_i1.p1  ORF type:complete len:196 (-),score=27.88 TRINITY_DN26652_c0_g1_i1:682-1269(-)